MDILINAANLLYVAAYFTTNMLLLRILTMIAAACLATYFYCQPVPMLNVVAWNIFFLVLNVVQVVRLTGGRLSGRSVPHAAANSARPLS